MGDNIGFQVYEMTNSRSLCKLQWTTGSYYSVVKQLKWLVLAPSLGIFFFARHCYDSCDNVLAKRSQQLPALWGMGEARSKGGFLLAPPTRPFSSLLLLLDFQVPSLCLSLAEEGCWGSISTLQRAFPPILLQNGSRTRCHLLLPPPFTSHVHFAQHTILFLSLVFVFVWGQELPAGKWDSSRTWAWVSSHLPPRVSNCHLPTDSLTLPAPCFYLPINGKSILHLSLDA